MQRVRQVKGRTWAAGAAVAAAAGLVVVWSQRAPIAEVAIRNWLDGQSIAGDYAVERLEPERAVLRDVRLAGGAFTAARVEVRLAGWPFAPRPVAVTLDRPVLRARIDDGGMTLGGLERLIPRDTDPDAPLPDIAVRVRDGRLSVATPAGELRATFVSDGRLADGFRGVATLTPAALAAASCRVAAVAGELSVTTGVRRVRIEGRGPMGALACADGVTAGRGGWAVDAAADPGLRRLQGSASLALIAVRGGGGTAERVLAGIGAVGSPRDIAGRWRVRAVGARGAGASAATLAAEGRYAARPAAGAIETDWTLAGVGLTAPALDLPPPAAAIGRALRPAGGFVIAGAGAGAWRGGAGEIRVDRVGLRAASGARIAADGAPLLQWSTTGWRVSGAITAGGGGLPPLRLTADGLSAAAGRARLVLGPTRLGDAEVAADLAVARAADGWRVAGEVRGGGRVSGWSVGRSTVAGAVLVDAGLRTLRPDGCMTVRIGAVARDALRLDPATARLCGDPRRPLAVSAAGARGALTVAPIRLTGGQGGLRLAAEIGGRVEIDGGLRAAGTVAGLAADGGALPVRVAAGAARWRWRDGTFELDGGRARLTDAAAEPRFEPMIADGLTMQMAAGRIAASGALRLPKGVRLVGFTATHDLAAGTGTAQLATGAIRFGEGLQPDEISTAFRGVVANVEGVITGEGTVRWTPDGVTSRGHAETAKLDLATAALGPVGGVSGRIEFDDLIAVTTPAGQTVRVASINPGVLVENGVVTFRMLGPTRVAVAGAQWPFVGGRLSLRPTEIAADEPLRRFTLDVEGADAAQFLARFDIPNLNVTGIFDGQMPLVFDGASGRIEKGLLVARPPGGVIQYAGEVGADAMGAGGRLAFDALKRLRYRSLGLEFDGALDGEIVTAIRFTGTNEAPVAPAGGVPVRASGLPFKFNVTVRAPFRQLLGAAASFGDVRETIRAGAAAEGAPQPDK
ncbi:MAG: YdbH domain-containing protein [Alphaproteobacteria bacterium]|nr:YdbH domain-containing protein [Alphaproteobacteria bacterium]